MSEDQHPDLDWKGGVPVARRFDDPYFSLQDGLAETHHVFLGVMVCRSGFGLAFTLANWASAPG